MKSWHSAVIGIAACTIVARETIGVSTQAASETSSELIVCDNLGSPAHAFGVGLELLIKLELMPSTGVNVASSTSSSGDRCIMEMRDRASTFAIMDRTVAESVPERLLSSREALEVRPLLVAGLWQQAAHFVIAKENLLSGTIGDFALLSSDQLMIDPALRYGAPQLLAKAGIVIDRDASNRRLVPPEALVESFDRGAMIGLAVLEPVPSPTVTEFLARTRGRTVMLELSERYVLADGRAWRPIQIPAASYPDIDQPIETFGNMVMLVAEADVTDETVYQVIKIMFDNLPWLGQLHDIIAQITIDHALKDADLPLHPGAARYYREIGVLPYEADAPKAHKTIH